MRVALWGGLAACLFPIFAAGCMPRGGLLLQQPSAPPAQRELKLQNGWAHGRLSAERQTFVLAFPRPEAKDGPCDFLIYLSLPPRTGRFSVEAESPGGVQGFLVQVVGALRGKATFVEGSVAVNGVWLMPDLRRIDLRLRCDDGSEISGRAVLQRGEVEVHAFERRYAADVALLSVGSAAGSQPGEQTAPRVRSAP